MILIFVPFGIKTQLMPFSSKEKTITPGTRCLVNISRPGFRTCRGTIVYAMIISNHKCKRHEKVIYCFSFEGRPYLIMEEDIIELCCSPIDFSDVCQGYFYHHERSNSPCTFSNANAKFGEGDYSSIRVSTWMKQTCSVVTGSSPEGKSHVMFTIGKSKTIIR